MTTLLLLAHAAWAVVSSVAYYAALTVGGLSLGCVLFLSVWLTVSRDTGPREVPRGIAQTSHDEARAARRRWARTPHPTPCPTRDGFLWQVYADDDQDCAQILIAFTTPARRSEAA